MEGRFFLPTEHFKKQGARAVAMAALEERRRSWQPDVLHWLHLTKAYHKNPPKDAYTLQHEETMPIQPRQSQLKLFQYSETHSTRLHAYILRYKKPSHSHANSYISSYSLFLCPMRPYKPSYKSTLCSSGVYMLWR
ncbi:hypothetical protein NQZ68_003710 [Dissostichus eleginoides]|nr:hypothetical protein NQZ68_003710 [Dissostichus eleginoides]